MSNLSFPERLERDWGRLMDAIDTEVNGGCLIQASLAERVVQLPVGPGPELAHSYFEIQLPFTERPLIPLGTLMVRGAYRETDPFYETLGKDAYAAEGIEQLGHQTGLRLERLAKVFPSMEFHSELFDLDELVTPDVISWLKSARLPETLDAVSDNYVARTVKKMHRFSKFLRRFEEGNGPYQSRS